MIEKIYAYSKEKIKKIHKALFPKFEKYGRKDKNGRR